MDKLARLFIRVCRDDFQVNPTYFIQKKARLFKNRGLFYGNYFAVVAVAGESEFQISLTGFNLPSIRLKIELHFILNKLAPSLLYYSN